VGGLEEPGHSARNVGWEKNDVHGGALRLGGKSGKGFVAEKSEISTGWGDHGRRSSGEWQRKMQIGWWC